MGMGGMIRQRVGRVRVDGGRVEHTNIPVGLARKMSHSSGRREKQRPSEGEKIINKRIVTS